jgi:hypothetical protein
MYSPLTLNVSNMISAVYSLFSGALRGGSVCHSAKFLVFFFDFDADKSSQGITYEAEIMFLRLAAQRLEDAALPKAFHVIPVLDL